MANLDGISDSDLYFETYPPEIAPRGEGYLPDVRFIDESVNSEPLKERITLISENQKQAVYEIDRCIRARVPSLAFRQGAVELWNGRSSSHRTWAWSSVALTGIGVGMAIAYSPYFAVAALASAIYAGVQFKRYGKAADQMRKWEMDPAELLASTRKEAYAKGFAYAYQNDLKLNEKSQHAVLLPFEIEYLFNRYLERTCQNLSHQTCVSNSQKKVWLDQFRNLNPVSRDLLKYVYQNVPERYASITHNFEGLAISLKNIESEFRSSRKEQQRESKELIEQINSQRKLAVAVPSLALSYKLNEASSIREEKLRAGGNRREIEAEYDASVRRYQVIYAAAILPITLYFSSKVKEAQESLKKVLKEIDRQEESAFSPYYDYAQEIVSATQAAQNENISYNQPPFNPSKYFRAPSFPKIEINFIYQPPDQVPDDFREAMERARVSR